MTEFYDTYYTQFYPYKYIMGTKNFGSSKTVKPRDLFSNNRAEKGGVDTRSLIPRVDQDLQPKKSIQYKKTYCPRARKKREGWSLLTMIVVNSL